MFSAILVASSLIEQTKSPLALEIVATPAKVKAGQQVKVSVVLRNISKSPVVVAKDYAFEPLSANVRFHVSYKGREVLPAGNDTSRPTGQSVSGQFVIEKQFVRLAPGASYAVYWCNFKAVEDPSEVSRLRKGDDRNKVMRIPMWPGQYELKATYSFSKNPKVVFGDTAFETKFTPAGKRMFKSAFSGSLLATKMLTVND